MTRLKKTLARTPSSLPRLEQAFLGLTREKAVSAETAAETERSRMEHLLLNRDDTHTLSVYVANKPGVLARIAQVFARRGYNIDSLVVSSSMDGKFSRMTVTAIGDPDGLDQIIAQVNKLVDVIHCMDHTGENAVVRELALIKVAATTEERTGVLQIAEHFKCKTVDLTESSIIRKPGRAIIIESGPRRIGLNSQPRSADNHRCRNFGRRPAELWPGTPRSKGQRSGTAYAAPTVRRAIAAGGP